MTAQRRGPQLYDTDTKKKRLAGVLRSDRTEAIVIPAGVKVGDTVKIPYAELDRLGVDARYQRPENPAQVNTIVRAVKMGGQIPDLIHVAVRKDGTWWIVDGQQRYCAAILADVPFLRAQLYQVPDFECEEKLFQVLNSRTRVHPNVIVKSWVGPGADLVRWLNEDEESPLRGGIGFGPGSPATPATTVLKAVLIALTGTKAVGGIERVLRYLDVAVRKNPSRAKQTAKSVAMLLKSFFNGNRMLATQVLPLMGAAHQKWQNGTYRMPTRGEIGRLHRLDWMRFAAPSLAPYAQKEVERRWKS